MQRKYQNDIPAAAGGELNPDRGPSRLIAWFVLAGIVGAVLYRFTAIDEATIIIGCAGLAALLAVADTAVLTGTIDSWIDYRKLVRQLKSDVDRKQSARLDAVEAEIHLLKSGMLSVSENGQAREITKWDETDTDVLAYCKAHLFAKATLQVNGTGRISAKYKSVVSDAVHLRLVHLGWVEQDASNYYWRGPDTIQAVGAALR